MNGRVAVVILHLPYRSQIAKQNLHPASQQLSLPVGELDHAQQFQQIRGENIAISLSVVGYVKREQPSRASVS